MANINRYTSHARAFFAGIRRFRDIHVSKFVPLKIIFNVITYNIRCGAIRWKMFDFLSDVNSNVRSISHRLRDIRKSMQNFNIENEGQ